jgi:hypothetical protein
MQVIDVSPKSPEQLGKVEARVIELLKGAELNVNDALKVAAAVTVGLAMLAERNIKMAELGAQMLIAQLFKIVHLQTEDDCGHEECRLAREEELRKLNEQ